MYLYEKAVSRLAPALRRLFHSQKQEAIDENYTVFGSANKWWEKLKSNERFDKVKKVGQERCP